jgi:cobalt-zinc-cadmium efflux system outer membrane protein
LQEAVALALENSQSIQVALQEIEAADGQVLIAGKIPNPELTFSWNEIPDGFDLGNAGEQDIGLTQELEFPTRRAARINAADIGLDIARLRHERLRVLTTAEVTKAYYRVQFSRDQIRGLESQKGFLEQSRQYLLDSYAAGGGSALDILRTRVEIARLNNEIVEARRDLQSRSADLGFLLGSGLDPQTELSDTLMFGQTITNPDSTAQVLFEQSTVLRIARLEMGRRDELIAEANAGYLPDFSLGIFHQVRANEPPFDANSFTGVEETALGLEVGISIPLWFWQEPKGMVKEAEAMKAISQANHRAIERRVRTSLANALITVAGTEDQMRSFTQSLLRDAQDIVATGLVSYRNNQIDLLNLLDILRTAQATRLEYQRTLLNHAIALAELTAAAELQGE